MLSSAESSLSEPLANICPPIAVCSTLLAEHRQMETLLDQLEEALNIQDIGQDTGQNPTKSLWINDLQTLLQSIAMEMNTHFACEEQALFPAVEPYHPMVLMRVEHEELLEARKQLFQLLSENAPVAASADDHVSLHAFFQAFGPQARAFIEEMRNHIAREDAGIFPACEQALSDDEKQQAIKAMAAIRQAAQHTPTPSIQQPVRHSTFFQADLDKPLNKPIDITMLADEALFGQVKHLRLKAGQALPQHWSPKPLLVVCLQGTGVFQIITPWDPQQTDKASADQASERTLLPGSGVLLDPQVKHALKATTDCHLLLLFANNAL